MRRFSARSRAIRGSRVRGGGVDVHLVRARRRGAVPAPARRSRRVMDPAHPAGSNSATHPERVEWFGNEALARRRRAPLDQRLGQHEVRVVHAPFEFVEEHVVRRRVLDDGDGLRRPLISSREEVDLEDFSVVGAVRLVVDAAVRVHVRPQQGVAAAQQAPRAVLVDDSALGVDVVDVDDASGAEPREGARDFAMHRTEERRASSTLGRRPASPGLRAGLAGASKTSTASAETRRRASGARSATAARSPSNQERNTVATPGAGGSAPETPTERGGSGSDAVSARSTAKAAPAARRLDRRPANGCRQRRPGPRRRHGRADDAFRRRAVRELERVRPDFGGPAAATRSGRRRRPRDRGRPPQHAAARKAFEELEGNSITSTAASSPWDLKLQDVAASNTRRPQPVNRARRGSAPRRPTGRRGRFL